MDGVAAQGQSSLSEKISGFLQRKPVVLQLLRFVCIGVLNTALDFLILNFVSKSLGVSTGLKLGGINIIGFSAAVVQSYFWNKYWAFGSQNISLWQNFTRLFWVGFLGLFGMLGVLLGAYGGAFSWFYLLVLAVFAVMQAVLWKSFGLFPAKGQLSGTSQAAVQFWSFITVSVIGLAINSALLAFLSDRIEILGNSDLNKNIAKILATFVSLAWNFIAYKLIVFKK